MVLATFPPHTELRGSAARIRFAVRCRRHPVTALYQTVWTAVERTLPSAGGPDALRARADGAEATRCMAQACPMPAGVPMESAGCSASWYHECPPAVSLPRPASQDPEVDGSGLKGCTDTQHVPCGWWFVFSLHCEEGGTLLWIFTTWYSVGP